MELRQLTCFLTAAQTQLPIADLAEEFIFALVYRRLGALTPSARKFIAVVTATIASSA